MKISDLVIDFYESKGIDTAFTISGGGCIHLIDSLRKSNINCICSHHEQAALMAAEGYTRLSNKLALNVVTTGPGGTNTLTGLLGLWLDSIPSIIISGQVPTSQLSKGTGCRQIGDQEFDIVKVVKPMTKYAITIKDPQSILYELQKAYHIATTGRPGPVWIDIPLDIQGGDVVVPKLKKFEVNDKILNVEEKDLEKLYDLINQASKPLLIVGNGIRLSDSYEKFKHILYNLKIPVVTGPHSGVDCVDNTYEFYSGRIGVLGQLSANKIVQESDLLICLGTRLPVKMTGYNIKEFSPNSKKIFVDIDQNEIDKHKFDIELKIVADLKLFLKSIDLSKISTNHISNWREQVIHYRSEQVYVYPKHYNLQGYASFYYLISKAPSIFKNIPIITSNGTAHVITLQTYQLNQDQRVFTNVGCASMGYGLPAAIGASISSGNKEVICIEGDGSIMMNLQELQTVKGYNLPVKIIIINNEGYLSIKLSQESFFNGAEFASGPSNGVTLPSYEKVAKLFDFPYISINSNNEVESALQQMVDIEGPCIVEVFTHPKEKHEPKVTHRGIAADGSIIPGTLTDMSITDSF